VYSDKERGKGYQDGALWVSNRKRIKGLTIEIGIENKVWWW